jgi:RNA polymerase sigma-70 factor, ECF subfamily
LDRLEITERRVEAISCVDVFIAQRGDLARIVAGMGFGPADADDVLQDVSVKALNDTQEWHSSEVCCRWLIKVTVNACLTEYRRRKVYAKHAQKILKSKNASVSNYHGGFSQAVAVEELETIRMTLQTLNSTMAMPITLRYFCGFSSNEIAELLGITPGAVRARLYQARLLLAKKLRRQGIDR